MENLGSESSPAKERRARNPASTTCPKCGSEDTRSFEMVYTEGTSTGTFAAGSYTLGVGATLTKGQTTNQSILASRTQPPIKPTISLGLIVVAFVFSFIIAMILFSLLPNFSGELKFLVFLGVIAGLMALVYFLERKRQQPRVEQYEKDIAVWRRSWICLRCGHAWRRVISA